MKPLPRQVLDARDALQIAQEILARRPGYLPEWLPPDKGPDAALLRIFARYLETILRRLNQAPEKNKLAFLDLAGVELIPAQAARAPIVMQLFESAPDGRAPAGTRVVAPPPPESTQQIIFETERGAGLAAARLKQVVSLWPGRDQYLDHSEAHLAGRSFQLFKKSQLQDVPHIIYLAHDTLLALAGKVTLDVEFELSRPSAEALDTLWEYWDGEVWRNFKAMRPVCLEENEKKADGTDGFTRSGRFRLETDCAESAKTIVNGIEAFWVRGRLTEPLLQDSGKALPEVEQVRLSNVIERPLIGGEKDDAGNISDVKVGLLPDMAFANGTVLDLTKPFFPYGNQPLPGDTFYFSSEEIFSKPGAKVEVVALRSESPQDRIRLPKEPAEILITAVPPTAPADGESEITLTVVVKDINGAPIEVDSVRLTTTLGLFENGQDEIRKPTDASGQFITTITSENGGEAEITAEAGIASSRIKVTFFDRKLVVTFSKKIITANNVDRSDISVEVRDLEDNLFLEPTPVKLTATRGLFANGQPIIEGQTVVGIFATSLTSTLKGSSTITVTSGVVESKHTLYIYPPIQITPVPPVVLANGTEESTITVTVVDFNEANVPDNTVVRLTASLGNLRQNELRTLAGIATTTITSTQSGDATITAQADVAVIENNATITGTILGEGLVGFQEMLITASTLTVRANNTDVSTITVKLCDSRGRPRVGVDVTLTTNLGTLAARELKTDANGQVQTTIKSAEAGSATITARAGRSSVQVNVLFIDRLIGLSINPPSIVADGTAKSTITATVTTLTAAPFPGVSVTFTTTLGLFSNGQPLIEVLTGATGAATTEISSTVAGVAAIIATSNFTSVSTPMTFVSPPIPAARNVFGDVARIALPASRDTSTEAAGEAPRLGAEVQWEYWDGSQWAALGVEDDLDRSTRISFTVPPDMERTKVNEQEGLWVRVRLKKGGFGFPQKITWTDQVTNVTNVIINIVIQPPVLFDFRLGYIWQYGPFYPERALIYNDFQYEDQTEAAKLPGMIFQPFMPVRDITPALYLGFDRKLPVDRLNLYFDLVEQREEGQGPALLWEYWNDGNWRELAVEDETNYLRVPGMLSFIAAEGSKMLSRFGAPLHWLRGRLKEDGPPGEPLLNAVFSNAVWAAQRQTITDDPLGASNGQPDQIFAFRQIPVLEGERIEVRELAGNRANVEWRILAMEIFGGEARVIRDLEDMLGKEGAPTDVETGDLRLRRDRNKRVIEAWVRWQSRKHFFLSGPNDRHYVLDRAQGRLIFGNGERGKVPPPAAAILAKQYRTGGGLAGNVAARTITQLLAGIGGVETIFNPKAAEGGADAETLEAFSGRGPQTLRHRGAALLPQDYETMAKEASPAVAVARAIPCRNPNRRQVPGWVTLLIIPYSDEPRPWPSFGLREQVRKFIENRAAADLAAARHIYVTGPEYFAVDVHADIAPLDPAEAGVVEKRALAALADFFHPLRGGPEGCGWELGRDVFLSDIAAVLERVEGVDFVKELTLLLNAVPQGERVRVADDRIVVAGEFRLKLI